MKISKALAWGLLFWAEIASAQVGNFPALIGQRGATQPTNCAVAQLFFDTSKTAGSNLYGCTSANTWTALGGSSAIAFPATVTGGTSGGIPYFSATTTLSSSALLGASGIVLGGGAGTAPFTDANLVWDATNKRLTVGSTANGTSTGWILGYSGSSGAAKMWNAAQTIAAGNYAIYQDNLGNTAINAATSRLVSISVNDGSQIASFNISGMGLSNSNNLVFGRAAPTLASGGCTSPTGVTSNSTARFSVGVGTGCAGSQPLVFTLPANGIGYNCYAQNSSGAASSIPRQSSGLSTTSVTITNYAATTGLATAWTDADVVVVSCLGG